MRILQVTYNNVLSGRFNGRDLNRHFRSLGHSAQQCVWEKEDDEPHAYPWALQLLWDRRFSSSDVVYY